MSNNQFRFRTEAFQSDIASVKAIVESTGFFYESEVEIAIELVSERLSKGDASGYHFIFAEREGNVIGYACYGPIAGTQSSYDLYWIVVHKEYQRSGLGARLMGMSEETIAQRGGCRVYVETSSRPLYEPTRKFYSKCGYVEEALLTDFYAPGDSKVILTKTLR